MDLNYCFESLIGDSYNGGGITSFDLSKHIYFYSSRHVYRLNYDTQTVRTFDCQALAEISQLAISPNETSMIVLDVKGRALIYSILSDHKIGYIISNLSSVRYLLAQMVSIWP